MIFIGVGLLYAHLKDVKGFKLDVPAVISQHVHHQLQILRPADVLGHNSKVVSVQEKFPEKLQERVNIEK